MYSEFQSLAMLAKSTDIETELKVKTTKEKYRQH